MRIGSQCDMTFEAHDNSRGGKGRLQKEIAQLEVGQKRFFTLMTHKQTLKKAANTIGVKVNVEEIDNGLILTKEGFLSHEEKKQLSS